jgi:hypothetical protein
MMGLSMRQDFRLARTCRLVMIVTAIAAMGEALAAYPDGRHARHAGDFVVADDTGVFFIPRADILRVLELCEKKKKDEDVRIEAITQGVPVPVFYGKG